MVKTSRHFRLDDQVYAAAQERAKREYTTVTALIEHYLAEYAGLIGSDEEQPAERRSQPSKPVMGYSKQQQTGRKS